MVPSPILAWVSVPRRNLDEQFRRLSGILRTNFPFAGQTFNAGVPSTTGGATRGQQVDVKEAIDINKQGRPIVWNYSESPPRIREAVSTVQDSPENLRAPARTNKKPDFMRTEQAVDIEEALAPPPNLLPPIVNGPYLQPNTHPFNSVPTVEQFFSPVPVSQNGQTCTCQGPRNDRGLIGSRFADPIRDIVFMPQRFTDPCPIHGNDHIYGQGNSARSGT